ncbi:hypothetical protein DSECCO2_474660 [anaerobic digester metagenome]
MEVAHRDDEVDGVGAGVGGKVDVPGKSPDVGAALGGKPGVGDDADGLALSYGSGRGPGFDDVDPEVGKMRCNLKFLGRRQADTRCLFAVP